MAGKSCEPAALGGAGVAILCLLLAARCLLLSGCTTIYNPATGRRETVLDTSAEVAIGKIAKTKMGLLSLKMGNVADDQLERVQRIGGRLAAVSDRQDLQHQFGVIRDNSFNAFAMPGGTIYVHSGLLAKVEDDELASVLGHEVGHMAARHMSKRLQAQLGYALLMQIATSAAGMSGETARMVDTVYSVLENGFSREDELEADRLGIRYLHRAGIDPKAAVRMLEFMQQESPEGVMDRAMVWKRTHPLTSERIKNAKAEIARLTGDTNKFVSPSAELFCPECGRTYPPGTKHCEKDGTRLKDKGRGG